MAKLSYAKPEKLSLKGHPDFTEKWLQDRIVEDTSILGLGDLIVIERERSQEHAGRLDLLLADPEQDRRFEVELMLGPTDESHVIRCIEYWENERRLYPGYDHCAVLVAEDITRRFLNVLSLFAGNIPLIAIQLNALQVGDQVVLDFVRVLDRLPLRKDDEREAATPAADRPYWDQRASPHSLALVDKVLAMINEKAEPKYRLNYNRYYIGLHDGTRVRNFVYFRPRKQHVSIFASVPNVADWVRRFDEEGLEASERDERVRVAFEGKEFEKHRGLFLELLNTAVEEARR